MQSPIVLIIFRRPDTTFQVFEKIRQARPSQLFIIADGPRPNYLQETEQCEKTRKIVETINWDCEVLRSYSDDNLGCKVRFSTGIDWVFEQVEEAIILEDDCLPEISFFEFCSTLLNKYRHDTRIMTISGNNFYPQADISNHSYYFSRYPFTWGWATWRRAWQHYDISMKNWLAIRHTNFLSSFLHDSRATNYWSDIFQKTYTDEIEAWDYRWTLACWLQNSLSVVPNVNLVKNIGFGMGGTNTLSSRHFLADLSTKSVTFPLQHPAYLIRDGAADQFSQNTIFNPTLTYRLKRKLSKFFSKVSI
jgi:hypothetical protein